MYNKVLPISLRTFMKQKNYITSNFNVNMLNEDDILKQFTRKEDILKIFHLINSKKIVKTPHFYDRLLMRDLSEEIIDETFPQKDKIRLIDKREHKKDIGYDLYYELSGSRTLKLCFIPLDNKTLLINAILRHRKWQGSIRHLDRRR